MISFAEKIYRVVRKIPRGKTLSYKEVARLMGRPRAYRAVGNKEPIPIIILKPRCQHKLKISRLAEEIIAIAIAPRRNNEIFNLGGNPKWDTANFVHNFVFRARRR